MKAPSLPFGSNILCSDTPHQIKIILTKTCGVVKPDLGNTAAAIFYCYDLLFIL